MDQLPRRKNQRLPSYAYGSSGIYFITICTQNRRPILSTIQHGVGAGFPGPSVSVTALGQLVQLHLNTLTERYPAASVLTQVIMPDHVHIILEVRTGGPGDPAPTLSQIMGWFKFQTTKDIRAQECRLDKVWQRGYYEHVIRNQEDLLSCWAYIDSNPAKWLESRPQPV